MKVVFVLNGLTHYFNTVLNKLNSIDGIEIICIVHKEEQASNIGTGVHLSHSGIEFKVHYLNEIKRYYGKTFFKHALSVLKKESPKIIVIGWPYILEFIFNPLLLWWIKKQNIKILYRDIPFQLQSFDDAIRFRKTDFYDENLQKYNQNHFSRLNNFFIALLRKVYFSISDLILLYTEEGVRIIRTFCVPKEKIIVTYNSPDTNILFDAKRKANQLEPILPYNNFRLIHVGRLVKWKRVDMLINSINALQSEFSEIELVIIGNGPELRRLEQLSAKLNLTDKISFVGAVYDPVLLGRYFAASSIYILAGMGGLSINEAMLFGKPIICSVCDGTEKKLVRDGFNGYYFEDGNLKSLIEKISILLKNEIMIKNFGTNSTFIIENEININSVINGYLEAFNKVCYIPAINSVIES